LYKVVILIICKWLVLAVAANRGDNKTDLAMKKFLTELIIFALFLTAPLSFTGDRCPDFKPDCSRSRYITQAIAASQAQQRTTSQKSNYHTIQPVFSTAADSIPTPANTNQLKQFIRDPLHGRAPPLQHPASA